MKRKFKILISVIFLILSFILFKIYLQPIKTIDGKYISNELLFFGSFCIGIIVYSLSTLLFDNIENNDIGDFDCTGGAGGIM